MSIYFPRPENPTNIPEEIFFSIIKYLRPGAIWLFCRPVSRTWKTHVDSNIERYYRLHALTLKSEHERYEEMCRSENPTNNIEHKLQEDSLYLEILWNQCQEGPVNPSFLVLKFQSIDIPEPHAMRDLSVDSWEEKVTFATEVDAPVFGTSFTIWRIEHFLFPGFVPANGQQVYPGSLFQLGSHTIILGSYQVQYTLTSVGDMYSISIKSITVPLRTLMTFSTPHVVGAMPTLSRSADEFRHASALFDSVTDEVGYLPGSALAQRLRENYVPWQFDMVPLCEMCAINPLDQWCEAKRCQMCCFRDAVCIPHLCSTCWRPVLGGISVVEEMLGFNDEGWCWGSEEGQQQKIHIDAFLESNNEALMEICEGYGQHLGVSYNQLPPSGHDPNSEDGFNDHAEMDNESLDC
jgi:hypothetical protein